MTAIRPKKLSVATRIRRSLKRGLSPMEVAKATGASVSYVYTIKARMDAEPRPFANPPTPTPPNPATIRLEVPLVPFAPIPQGIAGLHAVKEEPAQPVAAHAASEIVEEAVTEGVTDNKYVWVGGVGILLLTFIMLYYFAHRG